MLALVSQTVDLGSIISGLISCFRSVFGVFTTDYFVYSGINFSIFDVIIGTLVLGLVLKLVFSRMHLAATSGSSAIGSGKAGKSGKTGKSGGDG